jgi:hypothetical protein
MKIGRNDPCPCNSGRKFKKCCLGKFSSSDVLQNEGHGRVTISIRERNQRFLVRIFEALQFDTERAPRSLDELKVAFTDEAVKKINEAIMETWPSDTQIYSVLESTKADISGLYVGEYEPELVLRGVSRHSLYANKILLVDPFIYPLSVRDRYNPILHPELYRSQTLRNVHMWFQLAPWIDAGIVEFIRTPADFDAKLNWDSMQRQKKKFDENEELKEMLQKTVTDEVKEFDKTEAMRLLVLSAPDGYLRMVFRKLNLGTDSFDEERFITYINELRRQDPYYLEPTQQELDSRRRGELHIATTGASYDIAKLTAFYTGSYLVTDIPSRWKEIEIDRSENRIGQLEWSPMAKAFHAMKLRNEGRLESLRVFLKHLWQAACSGNPYGSENVQHLADELEVKVREAEEEWKQIDRDVLKWFGAEMTAATLMSGPSLIETGYAAFLAAAVAVAGIATVGVSTLKRKGFPDKFPAAFFMDLKKEIRQSATLHRARLVKVE